MHLPFPSISETGQHGQGDRTMSRKQILSFGYGMKLLGEREQLLKDHGYDVVSISTLADARAEIKKHGQSFFALVVGHAVPDRERLDLARRYRRLNPSGNIVYFYRGRIRYADDATAVLNANYSPSNLLEAIWHLEQLQHSTMRT